MTTINNRTGNAKFGDDKALDLIARILDEYRNESAFFRGNWGPGFLPGIWIGGRFAATDLQQQQQNHRHRWCRCCPAAARQVNRRQEAGREGGCQDEVLLDDHKEEDQLVPQTDRKRNVR
ncbi:uncharacterized protein LOC119765556 isoform X1 [Culex quinquefasciatus]|uniref:uncharacterized protein LOC119765556 isoform X1 n=1 Tax=Culex quinquefasciatus TaxID=7176 RepID=UPI0018E337FF|nr:uncharacterized protein LOC119765556 isoform X1 [Culex quinquefasciatus]